MIRLAGREISAVTFDFWNTLCVRVPGSLEERRAARMAAVLDVAGVEPFDAAVWDAAMGEAYRTYEAAWRRNEQFSGDDAARFVVAFLGTAAGGPGSAAGRAVAALGPELVAAYHEARVDAGLVLTDGVAEVLARLDAAGVRIGIVCDVGFLPSVELRHHLGRLGVLGHFDHWSFSDEVGVYKPDRRIFEHALAGLGVGPERAAHVGDYRRTDVAGSAAMGMLALRYRGVFDDTDPAEGPGGDVVLGSWRELVW